MTSWLRIVLLVSVTSSIGSAVKAFSATAFPCTLVWQASPDPSVAGYALYYNSEGSSATNRLDVGPLTSVTINNLAPATYFFSVVAYDSQQNESVPSNLLVYTAVEISPLQFSVADGCVNVSFFVAAGASCHVEYTTTLNPPLWTVLTTTNADSNGLVTIMDVIDSSVGTRFYRGVVP